MTCSRWVWIPIVSLVLCAGMVLYLICPGHPADRPERDDRSGHKEALQGGPATEPYQENGPCLNVSGQVYGAPRGNSAVLLYSSFGTNYDAAINAVRTGEPIDRVSIDQNKRFFFGCLRPGDYVLALPTETYRGAIGYPIIDEHGLGNLTLDYLYQGGDKGWALGVFSIRSGLDQTSNRSRLICMPVSD